LRPAGRPGASRGVSHARHIPAWRPDDDERADAACRVVVHRVRRRFEPGLLRAAGRLELPGGSGKLRWLELPRAGQWQQLSGTAACWTVSVDQRFKVLRALWWSQRPAPSADFSI